MTTKASTPVEIDILPGCQPNTDRTPLSTQHSTFSDKIRWFQGVAQKIGGYKSISFDYGATISGYCRRIFSAFLTAQSNFVTLIGTNLNLYSLTGTNLTNITPLQTTVISAPNSLISDYHALPNNPVSTVSGSNIITFTDLSGYATQYQIGDEITVSGASAVGGLTTAEINNTFIIRSTTSTSYSVIVTADATSTATGGGSSVVVASGLLTVTATGHGMSNGQRVKISGASASVGGIPYADINAEFIVIYANPNAFQIQTNIIATSYAAYVGGSGVGYQKQIAGGSQNGGGGQGYGMGYYGVGLYGTGLLSENSNSLPLIWYIDRYEATVILCQGNQTGVYTWNGNTEIAPSLLSGAPTAVNYAFVSNDIVVTFGYQGVANQIFASDQQNITQWTATYENQVFQDTISGAGPLISHLPVQGVNLIFSNTQTYLFSYIGLPNIWSIQLLSNNIGIIAPMARVTVNGVGYWMGQNNFYRWRGAIVEVIPSNSQEVSTILNYVFENLNQSQKEKIFAWYNEKYGEIWFHYPSAASNEPDRVARVNINENFVWTPDTFDRTAAEYPDCLGVAPRLISAESILYNHETGTDADGAAMPFTLQTNLRTQGKNSMLISTLVPDSIQDGNLTVTINAYEYPQSSIPTNTGTYTITPTTPFVPVNVGGRFWEYVISGDAIGQDWIGGKWTEYVQEGSMQ